MGCSEHELAKLSQAMLYTEHLTLQTRQMTGLFKLLRNRLQSLSFFGSSFLKERKCLEIFYIQ